MENFREYNAWLQSAPGNVELKYDINSGGHDFAENELRMGLGRLNPRALGREGNEYKFGLSINEEELPRQSYSLKTLDNFIKIEGGCKAGLLYGIYTLLSYIARRKDLSNLSVKSIPAVRRRVLNHWDNMSGDIERGYAGRSLFFEGGKFSYCPKRIEDYARLLASIGINAISINNVNVTSLSAKLVTEEFLPEVAALADIFRPFGIRLIISADFEGPVVLGGLKTADPLDEDVIKWWKDTAKAVYKHIPDLGGFVIKADSEFRDGPATLGRTQADGANVIARALAAYGGVCYWRCFVYDCRQDWRDTVTDRPKAAFDHFYPLDGKFDENVILQIKNGPVDFQVREPNSPLLGRMKHTAQAIEFQATQEYTGQQIDLYALAVQWEEFFKEPISEKRKTIDIAGKEAVAIVAVNNVGRDENWTGHLLAQANLYAFGRMAFEPSLTAREVTEEWVELTFGFDAASEAHTKLTEMMLASRAAYEKYTAPLGLGWMVNINHHYGPSPDGYEYMKWGTYHRADSKAIGVDRTKDGTGYAEQYDPWLAARYSGLITCPEELLLFFHRLPYDHVLSCGRTLLQYIYDTRFEGASEVLGFIETWDSLEKFLPEEAYLSVKERLKRQLENACEWRDVVNSYFYRKTGVADRHGRKIYG